VIHNSAGKIAEGVDIRGIGGYIVAAPSIHPTGTRYTWLDVDGDVPEGPCSDAPLWLVDMAAKSSQPFNGGRFAMPAIIPEGTRDITLYKLAASMRSQEFGELEIRSAIGAANLRCSPPLPSEDLDRITRSIMSKPAGRSEAFRRPQPSLAIVRPDTLESEYVDHTDVESHAKLLPNAVGDRIMRERKIINVADCLYEYTGQFWDLVTSRRLKVLAAEADGPFVTSQKRRNEIADYIQTRTHRERQHWREIEDYEIPCGNGVVDIRSHTLRPHRPEDMLQAICPVEYDPRAQCPELMRCLDTYFGADDDGQVKIDALQEFFGYCLMPHAKYKKALLCVGESDSGKSTINFLLRRLLGAANICQVAVGDMDDPRKRAPMMGKLVNLLSELTSDAMIADGGFKTLVSIEEPIQFDQKFLPAVTEVPICKHVIVTNSLPIINDRSRGTFNRLLIIRFTRVIPRHEQDRHVWDRLEGELPGILLWALEGAARLFHRGGQFTEAGAAEVEQYRESQNPISGFLADECDIEEDARCFVPDMRDRYIRWGGRPVSPQLFATMLRANGLVVTDNPIWIGGTKKRAVLGVKLR
jgi:putative DNA primase/helicase